MVHVYCDGCGKEIRRASRGSNYVTLLGYELCLPCREDLLRVTGKEIMKKDAYHLKSYQGVFEHALHKMCR
jgi:hypothetical protein